MEAAEVWFVTKVLFKVLTKNDEWPSDILFFKDAVYFLTVVLKLETFSITDNKCGETAKSMKYIIKPCIKV